MSYETDDNPLRDTIGNFRTQSLFLETNNTENKAMFTLKDDPYTKNGVTYPSLKRIYLSYDDPTEWQFVMDVFGNWRHWERICGNKILRAYVDQWRMEHEIMLRSKGVRAVVGLAQDKESAAKWLAEGKWKGSRGRPSKEEVEKQKKIEAGLEAELNDHWERLMPMEEDANSKPN